jgi:galactan endo-1,6-beta-galactosidase
MLALCLALVALSPVASVTVDTNTTLVPEWEGWGTSLAWWANVFGQREDIADALFTLNTTVTVESNTVPGLGMNIARYNFGGSSFRAYTNSDGESVSMTVSSAMPAYKAIETFWQDPLSDDPSSSSWNWTADANQRQAVLLGKQRGVNILEAFSNAPPWWMTKNLATAGGAIGSDDNLAVAYEQQFAQFFAIAVSEAKKRWDIDFQYVELFNEPSATWWTYPQGQEGCHFSLDSQARVLGYLRQSLDEYSLQSVAVAASDENSPTVAFTTLTTLTASSTLAGIIDKVNTHDYDNGVQPYRGPDRGKLRDLATANGMKLWDSENGEGDSSGLTMAQSIALDLNEMKVSAFVYWQALDGSGWGLLQADDAAGTVGSANPKHFVLAQYSRHIRPGMRIVSTNDLTGTVAAIDEEQKLLVLVTVNANETAQTASYDLSAFSTIQTSVKTWTTETSGEGALYEASEETVADAASKLFTTTVPALGVKTLEILFG